MQQIPLPIHQLDDDTLDNFYGDNNLLPLKSLRKNFVEPTQPIFYLWGEKGCGKRHLLKAVARHFLDEQRAALYVPLSEAAHFTPAVLDNLELLNAVCLDDLQAVIGQREWEVAVFDLINRIKETRQTLLLISADQSPGALQTQLPDLASRLSWGEIYHLNQLAEEQQIIVLQQKAHQRGIELPADTAYFLIKRVNRDMHTLINALIQLDKASLQAQRKLTIPFTKEILGL